MRLLVLFFVLLGLTACEDTFAVNRPNQLSKYILSSATGYVTVPQDGQFGAIAYPGSGMKVTAIVGSALRKHMAKVEEATAPQTRAEALAAAKEAGASYLIVPAILHWEDRATEFSGLSDRVEIEIAVIEIATGDMIERAYIKGTNGIPDLASTKPEQLLPIPVNRYVDSLFIQKR